MRAELTPLRIALLVLYATTQTTRGARVIGGASAYAVERLIRSRLGGAGGYGKTACYDNSKQLVEAHPRVTQPRRPSGSAQGRGAPALRFHQATRIEPITATSRERASPLLMRRAAHSAASR
jgi:hypothetical protein